MSEDRIYEGEVIYPDDLHGKEYRLRPDHLKSCFWKTAEGLIIAVPDMEDKHLRNAALFLMGMGYTNCVMADHKRVIYLNIFRMEWERRMISRAGGNKKFRIGIMDSEGIMKV